MGTQVYVKQASLVLAGCRIIEADMSPTWEDWLEVGAEDYFEPSSEVLVVFPNGDEVHFTPSLQEGLLWAPFNERGGSKAFLEPLLLNWKIPHCEV